MSGRGMNEAEEKGFEDAFREFIEDDDSHPSNYSQEDLRLWKMIFRRGFYQSLEYSGITSKGATDAETE